MRTESESGVDGSVAAAWELTGNHYLAFPCVSPLDGAIQRVNVLHRGALGLLEWAATPEPGAPDGPALLAPRFRVDGIPAPAREVTVERIDRWIPHLRVRIDEDLHADLTLCAPGGGPLLHAGAVYRIEVENSGHEERVVEVALEGAWEWSLRMVRTSRPLSAVNRVVRGHEGEGLVLELGGEPGLAALAVLADQPEAVYAAGGEAGTPEELTPGKGTEATNGIPLPIRIARTLRVPAGGRASAAFYMAVAVERDGAQGRAASLRSTGADALIRSARLQLAQMIRRAGEPATAALLNRNLLFNAFYSIGRAVDDEALYPIVSRSPLCTETAVFRERDALLWSLPALTLADPETGREALLRTFEQYSHRAGAFTHYLDGAALESAFSLAHFCAYMVGLDRYVRDTGDESVLDEPIVEQVASEQDELVLDRLHPELLLGRSERLPSGGVPDHPFLTHDNALLLAFSAALERAWPEGGEGNGSNGRPPGHLVGAQEEVRAAIWRHCTAEVDGLRVLAWSTDLSGVAAVYDDPEGSLGLLPHLGFCDADDPVWTNTMELLRSSGYPFWLGDRPHPGLASRAHPDRASLPALCTDLLGPRRDAALAALGRLTLASDVACEAYDPETGATAAGPHHAAAAGLLAWTLHRALQD